MVAGSNGVYTTTTGTASAMQLRGARTYHETHTPAAEFAPGLPGAA